MNPDIEAEGSYTVAIGENITVDIPLALFCIGDGKTVWMSGRARYIGGFGLGYPGLEDISAVFLFHEGKGERGEWKEKEGGRRRNADCDSGYRIRT